MLLNSLFRALRKPWVDITVSKICLLLVLSGSPQSYADLPLTVEDLLTTQDRYRVDLDLYYFNNSDRSSALNYRSNTDYFNLNLGVRYGWSLATELSVRAQWHHQETRFQQFGLRQTNTDSDFNQLSFGINHKFSPDNDTPALLGFVNYNWNRNETWDDDAFSVAVGFTTYRSLDPILLSASLSYRISQSYEINNQQVQPGHGLTLTPSLSFAVNSWITLTGGLQWQWQQGDKIEGDRYVINTTSTELLLGLGYHWSPDTSLGLNTNIALSEDSGSGIRLNLIYKFDDPL